MDLRKDLLTRLANGERMSDLCLEYGISRKTAYKFKERLERLGEAGRADLSRAPHMVPHRTPPAMVEVILAARRKRPTWGSRKIKEELERKGHRMPSHGAIERILARAGLITPKPRRHRGTTLATAPVGRLLATAPHDVMCLDYKGQFRLGDQSFCYPLTITDQATRYIIACESMAAISDAAAREVCQDVFRAWGLPLAIRSDNGVPFASTGLAGLTQLSAYFLRLGIALERSRPGKPQDNGQHERMHRTLKAETTRPARFNLLQQQEAFDAWRHEFNHERPHQALGMKSPADLFTVSPRPLPAQLPDLTYPLHDDAVRVSNYGDIHIAGYGKVRVTPALAGYFVGIREELDGRWLITFCALDLGFADGRRSVQPLTLNQENPQ